MERIEALLEQQIEVGRKTLRTALLVLCTVILIIGAAAAGSTLSQTADVLGQLSGFDILSISDAVAGIACGYRKAACKPREFLFMTGDEKKTSAPLSVRQLLKNRTAWPMGAHPLPANQQFRKNACKNEPIESPRVPPIWKGPSLL